MQFLKTLCFKTLDASQQSLEDCCSEYLCDNGVGIRKQSLDQKFNPRTVDFLKGVLSLLPVGQDTSPNTPLLNRFSNIYIQDGTRFGLPQAYQGDFPGFGHLNKAGAQLQAVYDYKNGNLVQIDLCEGKRADAKFSLDCEWITENSLVIRDLGYFSIAGLAEIEKKGAFYISKVNSRTSLFRKEGESSVRLDVAKLVRHLRGKNITSMKTQLYIGKENRVLANAIIQLVPEQLAAERIRKAGEKSRSRAWQTSDEYRAWAHINLYITNLSPENIAIEDIASIYKLRWQIELMFKTWKSHHRIHLYKYMKRERFESYVYASLIGYIIQHRFYHYFNIAHYQAGKGLTSMLKVSKVFLLLKGQFKMLLEDHRKYTNRIVQALSSLGGRLVREGKKGMICHDNILNI
jgi:hypothetical protein